MEIGTIILSAKIVAYLLGTISILLVIIAIKPIMKRIKNMIMGAKGYGVLKRLNASGHWTDYYVKFAPETVVNEETFVVPEGFRGTIDEGIMTVHFPSDDCVPIDFYDRRFEGVTDPTTGKNHAVLNPVISPQKFQSIVNQAKAIAAQEVLQSSTNDMRDLKLIFVGALALLVGIAYLSFQNYSVLTSMQHMAGLA